MAKSATPWSIATVEEMGRIVTGKTPPTRQAEYFGDRYPFITPTDIDDDRRTVETRRFLSEDGRRYLRNYLLPSRATCFVCIGATIGKICMTTIPSFTNQQVNSVIADQARHDPGFVYYLLRHNAERIKATAGGAATPIINKSVFSRMEVRVPPLTTQRKISAILTAYDDLIENNTRRIKILDEMAQILYREWFVNFRFPGHENVRMVESELGLIPKGWEVKRLGEVIELAYGKGLTADERRAGQIPVYGSAGIVGYHDSALAKGPGIIVGRKGNVGSVYWSEDDFFAIDTVFFVQTSLSLYYCCFNLRNQSFLNSDAAVPGLNRNQTYRNLFLVPDRGTLDSFDDTVSHLFRQIKTLGRKNANLRQTRDLLLPKLVSGELDVSGLDVGVREEAS